MNNICKETVSRIGRGSSAVNSKINPARISSEKKV